MASSQRVSLERLFRTVPELEKPENRSGLAFVNILFGLVVTQAAIDLSREIVKFWDDGGPAIEESALSHLFVAISLTVLSWIGYHQSQQYPPFLIKFVNIPLILFSLDVLMVMTYYVVVAVAENTDRTTATDTVISHSAVPEAALVLVAFALYGLWDFFGYRMARDPAYAKRYETPRAPAKGFGSRRCITVAFLVVAAATALGVWVWDPVTPRSVVLVDALLIVVLVLYRIAKQAFDRNMKTRTSTPSTTDGSSAVTYMYGG